MPTRRRGWQAENSDAFPREKILLNTFAPCSSMPYTWKATSPAVISCARIVREETQPRPRRYAAIPPCPTRFSANENGGGLFWPALDDPGWVWLYSGVSGWLIGRHTVDESLALNTLKRVRWQCQLLEKIFSCLFP